MSKGSKPSKAAPDGVPEGFTAMQETEAAPFTQLGRDAGLTDAAAYTDGTIVGVSARLSTSRNP